MSSVDFLKTRVSVNETEGELGYYLLTDTEIIEERCVQVYGVAVTYECNGIIEHEKIHNVTSSKEDMLAFMAEMMKGTVFPISLRDIIEDFID